MTAQVETTTALSLLLDKDRLDIAEQLFLSSRANRDAQPEEGAERASYAKMELEHSRISWLRCSMFFHLLYASFHLPKSTWDSKNTKHDLFSNVRELARGPVLTQALLAPVAPRNPPGIRAPKRNIPNGHFRQTLTLSQRESEHGKGRGNDPTDGALPGAPPDL